MKEIRQGKPAMAVPLQAGYVSESYLRDTFTKLFGDIPARINQQTIILKACWIDTVLGPVIAITDERDLYLLEFVTKRGL